MADTDDSREKRRAYKNAWKRAWRANPANWEKNKAEIQAKARGITSDKQRAALAFGRGAWTPERRAKLSATRRAMR